MLVFHPFKPWKRKLCGGKCGWNDQGSIFHQPPTPRTEGPPQIQQEAEKTRVPVVCVTVVWRLPMERGECRQRVSTFYTICPSITHSWGQDVTSRETAHCPFSRVLFSGLRTALLEWVDSVDQSWENSGSERFEDSGDSVEDN